MPNRIANEPMIHIENLTKRFEEVVAVKDLSLSIQRGEIFAFLGPNGAGKTTTIKLLAGLLRPTSGRAVVGGYDIQRMPVEAKRLIGYIPDQPYLYEKLSGRDFFHFVGDLFEVPPPLQEERRNYFFSLFGLEEVADKLIESYSHGMRQKLVISAALMHEPKVLMVDEPLVGLDPQSSRLVKNLFRQITENGATVFLSTHTLSLAEETARRIGVIHRGELLFVGTLEEMRTAVKRDGNLEDLFLELTSE
jgi:ABC-2 type transport system ATP-binding protein